jgi:hypothetical protein
MTTSRSRNIRAAKTFLRSLFFVAAFAFAGRVGYSQGVDPIVEVPTAAHGPALIEIPAARQSVTDANADDNVTMAGEYKSTKNVIEEQKPTCWDWAADFGYTSEYNFRGTNLTPDADGAGYIRADVSKWGFTLGIFGIHQLGTARANSFSMGEGGGGGVGSNLHLFTAAVVGPNIVFATIDTTYRPETIQDRFNEIDVFFQYQKSLGWVDLTVGNIGFLIDRRAETFLHFTNTTVTPLFPPGPPFAIPPFTLGPLRTVENEHFDRFYFTLGTSKIPHIQPQITYYQTMYNRGQNGFRTIPVDGLGTFFYKGGERNNAKHSGYLEGKIKGTFPITEWLSFNPVGVISASFHDRTEPNLDIDEVKGTIRAKSLSGFNVAQAGVEMPIHLLHMTGSSSVSCAPADVNLYLVPFGWYSYHISDPTPVTDRNEWWGGAEFTVTF